MSRSPTHRLRCSPPPSLLNRACLGLLAGASAALFAACATAPGGANGAGGVAAAKPPVVAARALGPAVLMRCGKQDVTVRANAEQAELTVGSKRYLLQAQRSASGARYASSAYPGTSYWSKGDSGMLTIDGQAYPACDTIPAGDAADVRQGAAGAGSAPPRDLTVREWVVERIDGRGVVDNSRTTITWSPSGQLAGRAGCNRFTGSYRLQGAAMEVSGVATTRMICVPALMEQEARFLALLGQVTSFQLQRDGGLELRTQDQRRILAR